FGVMLTAQGPFINIKTGAGEWAIAAVAGLSLYAVISVSLIVRPINVVAVTPVENFGTSRNTIRIGLSLMKDTLATEKANITGMEQGLTRKPMGYLLPFEIVSVHLLVVLIAAAYLARAKRRRGSAS